MFCEKCGTKLPEHALFCLECGAATRTALLNTETISATSNTNEPTESIVQDILEADTAATKKKHKKGMIAAMITVAVILAGSGALAFAHFNGLLVFGSETAKIQDLMETAQRYLDQKDYTQAIIEFEKILKLDPMNVDAYMGIAEAYAATENTKRAIEYLEMGLEKTSNDEISDMLEEYRALNKSDRPDSNTTEAPSTEKMTDEAAVITEETAEATEPNLGDAYGEVWVGNVVSDTGFTYQTAQISPLTEDELTPFRQAFYGVIDFAYKVNDEYVFCVADCDKSRYTDKSFNEYATVEDVDITKPGYFESERYIRIYTIDDATGIREFQNEFTIAPEDMPQWWQGLKKLSETIIDRDYTRALWQLVDLDNDGSFELVGTKSTVFMNEEQKVNIVYDPDHEDIVQEIHGWLYYDTQNKIPCFCNESFRHYYSSDYLTQYTEHSVYYIDYDGNELYSFWKKTTEIYSEQDGVQGDIIETTCTVTENGQKLDLSDEEALERTANNNFNMLVERRYPKKLYICDITNLATLYEAAYRCSIKPTEGDE